MLLLLKLDITLECPFELSFTSSVALTENSPFLFKVFFNTQARFFVPGSLRSLLTRILYPVAVKLCGFE
jgi:hypothetical protein